MAKSNSTHKLRWVNKGGSPILKMYERKWDAEQCKFIVVEKGEYNIAEKIQAANNVSDLSLFYKQLQAGVISPEIETCEDDVIKGTDEYNPRNINDFNQSIKKAYASYEKLPSGLKVAFGSQAQYLDALASGNYVDVISTYLSKQIAAPVDTEKGDGE